MKLAHLFDTLLSDIQTIASHFKVDVTTADGGKTGLKTMWALLHEARANRAYGDSHPRWKTITRVLPHDGSKYCFWYDQGADDSHMETLLRKIKAAMPKVEAPKDFTLTPSDVRTAIMALEDGLELQSNNSREDAYRELLERLKA